MRCLKILLVSTMAVAVVPALVAADKDEKKPEPKSNSSTEFTPIGEVNAVLARGAAKGDNTIAVRSSQLSIKMGYRGKPGFKETDQDLPIELTADAKVRFIHLPPKTDEKGRKISYTEKEIKELRGDGKLKGYTADVDDLKAGKVVTLRLVKLKGTKGEMANKLFADRVYITGDQMVLPEKQAGDRPAEKKK